MENGKCEQLENIKDLKAAVFGKDGVKETVIRLDENIKLMVPALENLSTAIRGIHQFQSEYLGKEQADKESKEKYTSNIRWLIGIAIIMLGFNVTLIIAIVSKVPS